MKNLKISIFGGGTAGWFTALFAKKILPDAEITLIESKDLGIVGVGEATTPHIPDFLKYLDLDINDVIKSTNGTIKNGIRFDNWNGDGKNYFHSFTDNLATWSIPNLYSYECDEYYYKLLINKNLPFDEYVYQHKLAKENKVDTRTAWAIHFDATALANYLEAEGAKRNIKIIDSKIKKINSDSSGNISSVLLENDMTVDCDFVFDCTGFHRKIVGEHFNTRWISYSKWLPMKKGIPFWLPREEKTRPYTQAIAMKYGWMWKIPLQHRIGSGYIFDSDYIDEKQALKEAEQYYGQELEIRKIIPFEAGRFENVWIKNCMAVGLSSSFLEPLESTSLWITVIQLKTFKQFLNSMITLDDHSINSFNEYFVDLIDEAMNFIYLHYMTKRKDSEFWKNFRKKHPLPDKLEKIKEQLLSANIRNYDCFEKTFPLVSFLQVCNGLEIFEKKNSVFGQENVEPSPDAYREKIAQALVSDAKDHDRFLKEISQNTKVDNEKEFDEKGYIIVRNVLPEDVRDLLTQYALFDEMQNFDPEYEHEVSPNSHGRHADPAMESVLLKLHPFVEELINKKLYPTYSYFRVYRDGHILKPHIDRPSCEISVTLCFNYEYGGDYSYPIFMGGEKITMNPGDMVIYKGRDVRHYRETFSPPNKDGWHVQGFFHYVDVNGPYTEWKYDKRSSIGEKVFEKRVHK